VGFEISRVNWMIQYDRNMAFYHVSTLVRRKRNQIMAMKNDEGEWMNEERNIQEFIRMDSTRFIRHRFRVLLELPLIVLSGNLGFRKRKQIALVAMPLRRRLKQPCGHLRSSMPLGQMGYMWDSSKGFG